MTVKQPVSEYTSLSGYTRWEHVDFERVQIDIHNNHLTENQLSNEQEKLQMSSESWYEDYII